MLKLKLKNLNLKLTLSIGIDDKDYTRKAGLNFISIGVPKKPLKKSVFCNMKLKLK